MKDRPDAGTPIHGPPLVPPESPPDDYYVISEGATFVVGREVGKGREEPLLVCCSHGRPTLASQPQRMGLQEAVLHERGEDSVVVSGGFGVAMPLEQMLHLLGAHG
jgi:hypothetical protein